MLKTGQILNEKYEITKCIDESRGGTVYKAWNTQLRKNMVVKVVSDAVSSTPEIPEGAKVLIGVENKHLAKVIDVFESGKKVYLSLAFVEGVDLLTHTKSTQHTEKEIGEWMLQICDGVKALHKYDPAIIHGDIKPENIILRKDGTLCLIDFNVNTVCKKERGSDHRVPVQVPRNTDSFHEPYRYLTSEEAVSFGRSASMKTAYVDERTDIYAIGTTMYYLLTGGLTLRNGQASLNSSGISMFLKRIIAKATQEEADKRYANIDELITDLQRAAPNLKAVKPIPVTGDSKAADDSKAEGETKASLDKKQEKPVEEKTDKTADKTPEKSDKKPAQLDKGSKPEEKKTAQTPPKSKKPGQIDPSQYELPPLKPRGGSQNQKNNSSASDAASKKGTEAARKLDDLPPKKSLDQTAKKKNDDIPPLPEMPSLSAHLEPLDAPAKSSQSKPKPVQTKKEPVQTGKESEQSKKETPKPAAAQPSKPADTAPKQPSAQPQPKPQQTAPAAPAQTKQQPAAQKSEEGALSVFDKLPSTIKYAIPAVVVVILGVIIASGIKSKPGSEELAVETTTTTATIKESEFDQSSAEEEPETEEESGDTTEASEEGGDEDKPAETTKKSAPAETEAPSAAEEPAETAAPEETKSPEETTTKKKTDKTEKTTTAPKETQAPKKTTAKQTKAAVTEAPKPAVTNYGEYSADDNYIYIQDITIKRSEKTLYLMGPDSTKAQVKSYKEKGGVHTLGKTITDLSFVKLMPNLKGFACVGFSISDMSPLAGLSLQELDLSGNKISDISTVTSLSALKSLRLANNSISDLKPLKKMDAFSVLDLSGNKISNFSALKGTTIGTANFSGNKNNGSDEFLESFEGIRISKSIDISGMRISDDDADYVVNQMCELKSTATYKN